MSSLLILEWSATVTTALCVWLAARRNIATWPIGIVGCVLYGALFYANQLYADATLQVFFMVTGVIGWQQWRATGGPALTASRPPIAPRQWLAVVTVGVLVTAAYGSLLHTWTDAYAPFWDSAVLTLSVIAQVLLMQGRRETWPVWILVNTLSVPLFLSRGLDVTAGLYAIFWLNAWYGWWQWRRPSAPGAANGTELPDATAR